MPLPSGARFPGGREADGKFRAFDAFGKEICSSEKRVIAKRAATSWRNDAWKRVLNCEHYLPDD